METLGISKEVFRPYRTLMMVGFFCVAITVLSFVFLRGREISSRHMEFDQIAHSHAATIQRQIGVDLEIVRSIVGLYAASDVVTRDEFHKFTRETLLRHPELQALEWAPRVLSWERPRYEERARRHGAAGFQLTQRDAQGHLVRAQEREVYYPVFFLEPLVGNEDALGFDLGSEPSRLAALEKARDTGLPMTTAPVSLVQEDGTQVGVLVFYPIYKNEPFDMTVEGLREAHRGFALGVFRMRNLVNFVIPEVRAQVLGLRLVDVTDPARSRVLFEGDSPGVRPDAERIPQAAAIDWRAPDAGIPINIPGRNWVLQFAEAEPSFEERYIQPSWGILLFGTLLTILLAAYLMHRIHHARGIQALEGDLSKTSRELQQGLMERQRATEALIKSEARFAAVFKHGQFAMVVTDAQGRLVNFNAAFKRMMGYSSSDLSLLHFRELTFEADLPESLGLFKDLVDRKISQFEMEKRYVRKNGDIIWCRIGASALYGDEGELEATIAMLVDITSQKKAEMDRENLQGQLLQTRKMEAVGRLAGGIAHDFNNLLTVLRGYTSMALEDVPASEPVHAYLMEIEKTTDRAEVMTRQLLAFGRKQLLKPQILNVNAIVRNMERMLSPLIGENIDLMTHLEPHLMKVKVDIGQMEQVIMNLAVNARDAMPRGGRLTIATRNVTIADAPGRPHPDIPPGRYVTLAIRDTGEGMDRETMDRIFEPFFTTKAVGAGTGLGLATVYGVMTQSGGHIIVDSEVGRGSTFTIFLPGTEESAALLEEAAVPRGSSRGQETILLVEDEDMVRQVTGDALASFGYKVISAATGPEAIAICEVEQEEIHLILTDVIMPGMNGPELVRRLEQQCPRAKVLFMSGYVGSDNSQDDFLDQGAAFLAKPFGPDVLGEKVRSVLDGA